MQPTPNRRTVLLEGYTVDEILALPSEVLEDFVFTGESVVFRVGSAEVLGEFRRGQGRLVLELAQIEGGGEGVLPSIGALARRYALGEGLHEIEWIVHAVSCARPNAKLRQMLQRRGFVIRHVPGSGDAYHRVEAVRR